MEYLTCQNVTKTYPTGFSGRKILKALDGVSIKVAHNEVHGIIGPNGAGKSTLLKIVMGLVKQDSGEATIDGYPAGSTAARSLVGYLPEHPSLYPHLSPQEHLQFSCLISGLNHIRSNELIRSALQTVGLSEVATTQIKRFSKGMTQRAALAYAILHNPPILILDEPMSGLDPLGRQLVIDIIQDYHLRGTTILFCSHILSDVERICDRIAIMNKGLLIASTTPKDLHLNYRQEQLKNNRTPLETYFLESIQTKDS